MKFFEKACLVLFSIIIFVLAIIIILMTLGIVNTNLFTTVLNSLISKQIPLRITIVTSVVLLFISARFILFRIGKEELTKDGIILENANGKLIISKESLENMILSATKSISGIDYINSKTLLDKEHRLLVYVTIIVTEEIIVKDVSKQLQENIKETMKNTADLEVSSVSITVKNIINKKNKVEKNLVKKEKDEENIEKE
ncbi:MAG: alkaline shock response membrane anchor protein AmaP [Candidatus Scatovivens sp.]